MELQLHGRHALIGGSTSGLGLAIAHELAAEGCAVAVNGRDPDRLAGALAELEAAHPDSRFATVQGDVSVADQAADVVARAVDALGALEILVTNAGGPPAVTVADAPADAWQAALELNLLSTVNLCRAAVPAMRAAGWGRVVMLTSVAAKQPLGNLILSTTARAGVHGFSKALADEVAADGVTVNVVCPGFMRTERVDELIERSAAQQERPVADVRADLVGTIPAGRIGDPAELGALVTFLASARAAYITGTSLQIDGGLVRGVG
jgi:3-oxoacyl-[acyl-carrier protein] reductase